jgi:4-diphosphocytidyl-2-C-methyl-D-erythritol kinase
MGAGLGGGSADGAFMLKALNRKFNLILSEEQLLNYALQLGSDCPFFIINKPCFATGRGEILEHVNFYLSGYKIVLVNPGIHVSTKEVFDGIVPTHPADSIKNIIREPVETWKENLKNDFEQPVFQLHPEIKNIKEELYSKGAVYAAMTGTGSTVFGLFKNDFKLNLSFPGNYTMHEFDT